jgi:hypothetical protein
MMAQVFIDGAPTECDWGGEKIVGGEWVECDEWHLCRGCYVALMDGTAEDFATRRKKPVTDAR